MEVEDMKTKLVKPGDRFIFDKQSLIFS